MNDSQTENRQDRLDRAARPFIARELSQLASDYDTYLRELGWRDWSSIMRASRATPAEGLEDVPLPLRDDTLKLNIRRYRIYNATRLLAVAIMELVTDYLIDEREYPDEEQVTRVNLIRLTDRMLELRPNNPPVEMPDGIRAIPDPEQRDDASFAYDIEITRRNLVEHIREIVSDIMETAYGSVPVSVWRRSQTPGVELSGEDEDFLNQIDTDAMALFFSGCEALVSQMLHTHYLEPYFGQTPFLGEALLACVFKHALEHEDEELLAMLYRRTAKSGINIHNHIGVTDEKLIGLLARAAEAANEPPYTPVDTEIPNGSWIERMNRWGNKKKVEINTGDILVYRSRSKLAGEIGFAAVPSWRNWRGIIRHRLWFGSLAGMLLHLDSSAAKDGLTPIERIRGKLQYRHWLVPGYNHTGIAKVFHSELGIQMHRALDIYPDDGIRIVGLNQFAHNGPQMRFAVVKPDPHRFYRHMQQYRKKNPGYPESAWPGYVASVSEEGDIEKTSEPADWPTVISRDDYEELHGKPERAGETDESIAEWCNEVHELTVDHIIEKYLLNWGVHFATGFVNVVGGLYCAQTPVMAMRQATGIDLESHEDHFSLWVRIIKRFGGAQSIDTSSRIVAPSGTYVQPFQTVHGIDFPRIDAITRYAAETSPRYTTMSPEMRTILYDPPKGKSGDLVDEDFETDEGYFPERVGVVSAEAEALRAAIVEVQEYAGFKGGGFAKPFYAARNGVLWLLGM